MKVSSPPSHKDEKFNSSLPEPSGKLLDDKMHASRSAPRYLRMNGEEDKDGQKLTLVSRSGCVSSRSILWTLLSATTKTFKHAAMIRSNRNDGAKHHNKLSNESAANKQIT